MRKRAGARRRFITCERSFHVAVHILNREAPRGAAARLMTSAADGKNTDPSLKPDPDHAAPANSHLTGSGRRWAGATAAQQFNQDSKIATVTRGTNPVNPP